jgi:DNA end-binding protein Ku
MRERVVCSIDPERDRSPMTSTEVPAVRRVQVQVGGRNVLAEVEPSGEFCWVEVRGRRVRIPFKSASWSVNASTGVITELPPADDEVDEAEVTAARLRKVREAARRGPVPKSARESYLRARHREQLRATAEREFRSGLDEGRARLMARPLAERLSGADAEELIEFVMELVLSDRELRAGYRLAADLADEVDGAEAAELPESGQPVVPAPVEPVPTPPAAGDDLLAEAGRDVTAETLRSIRNEPSIAHLINLISEQVGEPSVFAEPSTEPTPVPMVAERPSGAQTDSERALSATETAVPPRALWVGTLSAGMVTMPVRLHSVHRDDHGVQTFSAHESDGGRIRHTRVCSECGEVVPADAVGRVRRSDGACLSHAEVKALDAESIKDLTVSEFVPAADVDVSLFESHYQLSPGRNGQRGYAAIAEALRAQDKIGVARVVLRSSERYAVVRAAEGRLFLSLLRWADQMREPVEVAPVMVSETEQRQAHDLVSSMSVGKFRHDQHPDRRDAAMVAAFDAKTVA